MSKPHNRNPNYKGKNYDPNYKKRAKKDVKPTRQKGWDTDWLKMKEFNKLGNAISEPYKESHASLTTMITSYQRTTP